MKIGLVVHFFDFRNDVRQWILSLARLYEVVLFVRPQDFETLKSMSPPSLEIRIIREKEHNFWNRIWEAAFRFFGKLPESRQNFYLMEQFKISVIHGEEKGKSVSKVLDLSMALPRILTYDAFLSQLVFSRNTQIEDIDQFVCFTELSDHYLIARLLAEKKPVLAYVYSWDHPCKHTRFSNRLHYLALVELQHISEKNIRILGATQMAYVERWIQIKDELPRPFDFEYVYFGCAIGVPKIVNDELEIVRVVAEVMRQKAPHLKLVVRPYPVLKDWTPYEELKKLENVFVDDGFRTAKATNISVSDDAIMEKFNKIHHSRAFLHLGTTLGIEASYTQAPSVLLDMKEFNHPGAILNLHNFIHQYQNDKYLNLKEFPNVVGSVEELGKMFSKLLSGPNAFQGYNRVVSSWIEPKSFDQLALDLKKFCQSSSAEKLVDLYTRD
jgi:hypothetical protein